MAIDVNLSSALARWTEKIQRLSLEGSRIAVVSQLAAEAQQLGSQPVINHFLVPD